MYCVGLTGTIASGKSTVAAIVAQQDIPVISADHIARSLTLPGEPALDDIIHHFGASILTATGELDRRRLRDLIFQDTTERLWLEQLLHPMIRLKIEQEIANIQQSLCFIEIPLLTDRTAYPYLNRVLLVVAERSQQIKRLMSRDKITAKQASSILATQASEKQYRSVADDILVNDGSIQILHDNVMTLLSRYLDFARCLP